MTATCIYIASLAGRYDLYIGLFFEEDGFYGAIDKRFSLMMARDVDPIPSLYVVNSKAAVYAAAVMHGSIQAQQNITQASLWQS